MRALELRVAGQDEVDAAPRQRIPQRAEGIQAGDVGAPRRVVGEDGPVDRVALVVQVGEGDERDIRGLCESLRAERERTAGHRLELRHDLPGAGGDEGRRLGPRLDAVLGDRLAAEVGIGHPVAAQFPCEHQRPVADRREARAVRQRLDGEPHRQLHVHAVAVLPLARDVHVAVCGGTGRLGRAVDGQAEALARPARLADGQREGARAVEPERDARGGRGGKGGLLPHRRALPAHLRRDELVHVEPRRAVVVDRLAEARGVLHAGADAAPEVAVVARVAAVRAGAERGVVDEVAVARVLVRADVVEEAALVEVGERRARLHARQALGQLEHVVGVARLRPDERLHLLVPAVDGEEVLVRAVAADGERAVAGHEGPEVERRVMPRGLAGQLVQPLVADELGELRVRVQAGQPVLAARRGLEHGIVPERLGELPVAQLAGARVELRQRLRHAAVLLAQRLLLLLAGQLAEPPVQPVGHAAQDLERLRVAAVRVRVEQAGVELVQRVVRRPDLLCAVGAVEQLRRVARQVALPEPARRHRRLALRELRNQVVRAPLHLRVAGRGVQQRQRAEVVAEAVPAQLAGRRLPAAVRLRVRRQARGDAEVAQHPVVVDPQQPRAVRLLRGLEGPVEQPHVRGREGRGRGGDLVGHGAQRRPVGGRQRADAQQGGPAQRRPPEMFGGAHAHALSALCYECKLNGAARQAAIAGNRQRIGVSGAPMTL